MNPMILLAVKMIVLSVISLTVGIILHNVMKNQGFKTNKAITMILSVLIALGLTLRFGVSIYTFQGLFLYFLLLYASVSDLTSRTIQDHVSVSILALSLVSIQTVGILSMITGSLVVILVQLIVCLCNSGRHGGADMKITTASAFLLGFGRGITGLVLGLLIGIVFMLIYNKMKKRNNKEGFPLMPFVSIGMMTLFFV